MQILTTTTQSYKKKKTHCLPHFSREYCESDRLWRGEKEKIIALGKIINVEGGILHGVIICEGCVSLEVQKSHDNEYVFFKSVELDDILIKMIEEDCR